MKKVSILLIIISVIILSCGSSYKECSCKSKSIYLPDRLKGEPLIPKQYADLPSIDRIFDYNQARKARGKPNKFFINPNYWKDSTDFNFIPDSLISVKISSGETFIHSPLTIGLSGAKMSGGIFIPAGTKVKVLDVMVGNSYQTSYRDIKKYKVKYKNHIGYIHRQKAELSKDMKRAKDLVYKWIKDQYCHPDDIRVYDSEGPVLYNFKNQNLFEPFVFMKMDFWRRCDSGFYTKENKVFKIDSNFDLEVFNVDGFALRNISSKNI